MDKRIVKTKRALKKALAELLLEKDFDAIKTTEICERALISRNTFYHYYADKYALLEDCFAEYKKSFLAAYEEKAAKTAAKPDIEQSFLNLIDTFFEMEDKFPAIPLLSNFDLMNLYYQMIMDILKKYEDRYAGFISSDYDFRQLNAFLALGFWGFIHGNPALDKKTIQAQARKLVLDLVESPIFDD